MLMFKMIMSSIGSRHRLIANTSKENWRYKMVKETYCIKSKETELSITNNSISAIKKSDTSKTGLRLYDGSYIGIAGAIGAYDENQLEARAKQMLGFQIPYSCEPAKDIKREVDLTDSFSLTDTDFMMISEELLAMLSSGFPSFSFGHKITYEESEVSLRNELGADLLCRDKYVQVALYIKHKESKNLMDSFGASLSRGYNLHDVFELVSETCASFDERIPVPHERMPVVFLSNHSTVLSKLRSDLSGRVMGTGASLFTGKIGEKLFADHFSLNVERKLRESYNCFFDAEGTMLPDDCIPLIENGILRSPFSSKKVAGEYGYFATGSAAGEYDSVPETSAVGISIKDSGKSIKELLGGRNAIYVVQASGGDFTPQGDFASPVQTAFVFDGERLLGRLPQISISSNIYDMFGDGFIGVSKDGKSSLNPFKYLAMDMRIDTIGDWI